MEVDPAFKQVIPYLVLRDGPRWFLMQRTRGGADRRLHDRWSIGVGGHLNPGDVDIHGGLAREWREELVADFEPDYRFVGLLNDDTTEVGQVHLGVVFVADAGGPTGRRPRDRQAGRRVRRPARSRAVRDRLETWSQLVFDLPRHGRDRLRRPVRRSHVRAPTGCAKSRPGRRRTRLGNPTQWSAWRPRSSSSTTTRTSSGS